MRKFLYITAFFAFKTKVQRVEHAYFVRHFAINFQMPRFEISWKIVRKRGFFHKEAHILTCDLIQVMADETALVVLRI